LINNNSKNNKTKKIIKKLSNAKASLKVNSSVPNTISVGSNPSMNIAD
jgi:hypothetical protein